jgi:hypothetical protein
MNIKTIINPLQTLQYGFETKFAHPYLCNAMNVFQMGIILILLLVGNTIVHPL